MKKATQLWIGLCCALLFSFAYAESETARQEVDATYDISAQASSPFKAKRTEKTRANFNSNGLSYTTYDRVAKKTRSKGVEFVLEGRLAVHEAAGGHLIARHVGKTETELLERLAKDKRISGSSSFTDLATAETIVSKAIESNQLKIQQFLTSTSENKGYSDRLVINYSASSPIGISVTKGQNKSVLVNNAKIIIQKDSTMPNGYKIITGYPVP